MRAKGIGEKQSTPNTCKHDKHDGSYGVMEFFIGEILSSLVTVSLLYYSTRFNPAMMPCSVDLPEPEGPKRSTNSPF
jgi:hypothetical protein